MSSTLVLLRHGQTDWNKIRRIQGQLDSSLDDLGHAQAEAVAPVLAALGPSVLWASDSVRARDTASYVAAVCGLEPRYDSRLREYFLGPRQGQLHHEYEADDPAEFAEFRRGNWDVVTGAEKLDAVAARMTEVLGELADAVPDGGVGLAVSHGAAIRTGTAALLGWPRDVAASLRGLDNCGWVVLQRPDPDAPWRMAAYNRVVTG
jgi:probable phosphoglycerate mutase